MDNPTCETCRWFGPMRASRPEGTVCFRFPSSPGKATGAGGPPEVGPGWRCGEHQPLHPAEAEAPKPAADAGLAAAEAKTMRLYADEPAGNGYVPIYPDTLRRWADLIDALSAVPPRPRIDPETRRVLEDAARLLDRIDMLGGGDVCISLADEANATWKAIRAHLAKLDGEGDHD